MSIKMLVRPAYFFVGCLLPTQHAFAGDEPLTCENIAGTWKSVGHHSGCSGFPSRTITTVEIRQKGCKVELESDGHTTHENVSGNKLLVSAIEYPTFDDGKLNAPSHIAKISENKITKEYNWTWEGSHYNKCKGGSAFTYSKLTSTLPAENSQSNDHEPWLDRMVENEKAFSKALAFADQSLNLSSVIVLQDNHILLEKYYSPYNKSSLHNIYSVTKSITSTLIGIAIDKQLIDSVDDPISKYLPEYFKAEENEKRKVITIENILTMSSGILWIEDYFHPKSSNKAWIGTFDPVASLLSVPMESSFEPGEWFSYNTASSHLLSALINNASGMTTQKFAQRYLFEPLGIESYGYAVTPNNDNMIGG